MLYPFFMPGSMVLVKSKKVHFKLTFCPYPLKGYINLYTQKFPFRG